MSRIYKVSNETLEHSLPEPGDVILFRTSESLGTMGSGKSGELYELDDAKKLRKIGKFALTKADDELVKEYQKE